MKKIILSTLLLLSTQVIISSELYSYLSKDELELLNSASTNNIKVLRKAVNKGVNVNIKTPDGITPLIFAVMNNNLEAVKFLVEKGANVNDKDIGGNTALEYAKSFSVDSEVTKYLISKGAN